MAQPKTKATSKGRRMANHALECGAGGSIDQAKCYMDWKPAGRRVTKRVSGRLDEQGVIVQ
jgi:hypothetical protein